MEDFMKITDQQLVSMGWTRKYEMAPNPDHKDRRYFICKNKISNTWCYEHILLWETYKGDIPKGYVIHHIDHNGLNNDLSNLICVSRDEHKRLHGKGIWIDGIATTLDEVVERFKYNNKGNAIRALKKGGKDPLSPLYGHEIIYK